MSNGMVLLSSAPENRRQVDNPKPLEGYLDKQAPSGWKKWKKRWFQQIDQELYYYTEKKGELVIKGRIPLDGSFSVVTLDSSLEEDDEAGGRGMKQAVPGVDRKSLRSSDGPVHSQPGFYQRDYVNRSGSCYTPTRTSSSSRSQRNINRQRSDLTFTSSIFMTDLTTTMVRDGDLQNQYVFYLVTPTRRYTLRAPEKKDMKYWIDGLKRWQEIVHSMERDDSTGKRKGPTLETGNLGCGSPVSGSVESVTTQSAWKNSELKLTASDSNVSVNVLIAAEL